MQNGRRQGSDRENKILCRWHGSRKSIEIIPGTPEGNNDANYREMASASAHRQGTKKKQQDEQHRSSCCIFVRRLRAPLVATHQYQRT